MTYLDWGCDPLREECESCIDALCKACQDRAKNPLSGTGSPEESCPACSDEPGPDCDSCDPEQLPSCSSCEIIFSVCRFCGKNPSCGFRICGP